MSFFKNKFFVIYLSLVSLIAVFIITFSILGNIERVGYISDFNSIDQGNTYHFQVGYRNNIFRHSDIYGVYSKSVDLPDYITSIEWDDFGSPFGTIVSTKELEKDFKIDINYTLRVKPDIYLYSIGVLLLILLLYILITKYYNSSSLENKVKGASIYAKRLSFRKYVIIVFSKAKSFVVARIIAYGIKDELILIKNLGFGSYIKASLPIFIKNILLPVLVLFSFLFYLFWSVPVSILSQELDINRYYIFDNPQIIISLIICLILSALLFLSFKANKRVFNIITGFIYFVVIMGTLYTYVLPYRYGFLQDPISLEASESLLGFSKKYYLLDILIILSSIFVSIFIVKKSLKMLVIMGLSFYIFVNGNAIFSLDVKEANNTVIDSGIKLSLNKKNFVIFTLDTTGPFDMLQAIESLPKDETDWTKDFKFFDNVVGAVGYTAMALPYQMGGAKFAYNLQIAEVLDSKVTVKSNRIKNRKYPGIATGLYFLIGEAMEHVEAILDNNVYMSTTFTGVSDLTYENNIVPPSTEANIIKSPVLGLSLYSMAPYFIRQILVDPYNEKKWSGRLKLKYKFTYNFDRLYIVKFEETEVPTINNMIAWGLHAPLSRYPITVSDEELLTAEGLKKGVNEVLSFQFIVIRDFIDKLKEKGIYDDTRIIITTDNAFSPLKTKILIENHKGAFEAKSMYNERHSLSTFIMDKGFNSEPNIFSIDSRSLIIGDIHSIIVTSFTNKSGYYDYTKVIPPKRIFNIIDINAKFITSLIYENSAPDYAKRSEKVFFESIRTNDGKFRYLRVNNLDTNGQEYRYYPFDKINELPAYEIVEEENMS